MDLTTKTDAELKALHEWAAAQYEQQRRKFEQAAHAREDAWMAVETIANELQRRIEAKVQTEVKVETAGRF
jgi:hypothetical protein